MRTLNQQRSQTVSVDEHTGTAYVGEMKTNKATISYCLHFVFGKGNNTTAGCHNIPQVLAEDKFDLSTRQWFRKFRRGDRNSTTVWIYISVVRRASRPYHTKQSESNGSEISRSIPEIQENS